MAPRDPVDAPVLTDGTVLLRAHRPGDLDAIVEQCADPDMVRFTTVPRPYTVGDGRDFLHYARTSWQQHNATSTRIWAIADAADRGRFAGTIDYRPTRHGTATVGYSLHPRHRGRGLMSAALGLVIDWAFTHDRQQLLHWQAVTGNWASAKTAWHHGFRLEGCVRGLCVQPDGDVFDGWIATLHRDDPRTPCQSWPWRVEPPATGEESATQPG
ncbi:GNAT family N-acetyltransferase [Nocardia wallacei]|uniref:GNAT family N-acetyltransferase n=1 Tax=Nocardia wallacei TaxID=480035 RepID=UPI002457DDAA|nr:GNAT family N-acetyltransferase [Nocardia wallacei]